MELIEFLKAVSDSNYDVSNIINKNPHLIVEVVESIYEKSPRHRYSDIFSFVRDFPTPDEQDLEFFVLKIREIHLYLSKIEHKYSLNFAKLYDHLELETQRKLYFDGNVSTVGNQLENNLKSELRKYRLEIESLKTEIENEKRVISEIKLDASQIDKLEIKTEDVTAKVNDLYVQFVTILGIFTAIVFAIFGGISSINSTVAILANNSIPFSKAMLIICVIVAVMTNLMYLFVFLMGKLINRPVGYRCHGATECHESGCKKRDKGQDVFCRLRNRHTLIWWSNVFILIVCIILTMVYFRNPLVAWTQSRTHADIETSKPIADEPEVGSDVKLKQPANADD